jgi:hypothetical protein
LFLSLRSKTAWESRFSKESFRTCGKQLAAQAGLAAGTVATACRYAPKPLGCLAFKESFRTCGKQLAAQAGLAAGTVATAYHCAPKPLGCLAFLKNPFAAAAGSSPRESGQANL